MDLKFKKYADALHPKFEALVNQEPKKIAELVRKDVPERGIYLFSEDDDHMYIGRSNNIRNRFGLHSRPSSTPNQASFAFLLAREETGYTKTVYKPGEHNRDKLLLIPDFAAAFSRAKDRVRKMDVRFVQEADPTSQALLEVYAAVVLGTRYNSFDNH